MSMADWVCPQCGQRETYRGEQVAPKCILCECYTELESTEELVSEE